MEKISERLGVLESTPSIQISFEDVDFLRSVWHTFGMKARTAEGAAYRYSDQSCPKLSGVEMSISFESLSKRAKDVLFRLPEEKRYYR